MKKIKVNVYEITLIGVMAALVFISSKISIAIPLGLDNTRLHLGNVFCVLSGIVLGSFGGGLAAGIGSFFFDLTDPRFVSSAPFTLVFKFLFAFICGKIAYMNNKNGMNFKYNLAAAIIGSFAYIVLHLSKGALEQIFFLNMEVATVMITTSQKAIASSINAIMAVVFSSCIAIPLQMALSASGLRTKIAQKNV